MTAPRTDDRFLALLTDTNDLRRAAGQAFHYLWLSLVLWRDRGRGFAATVRACCPGCATIFERTEVRLRAAGSPSPDPWLRGFVCDAFARLAADLEAGERHDVTFARWLDGKLTALTRAMRDEPRTSRRLDAELAKELRLGFGRLSRFPPEDLPAGLRALEERLLKQG